MHHEEDPAVARCRDGAKTVCNPVSERVPGRPRMQHLNHGLDLVGRPWRDPGSRKVGGIVRHARKTEWPVRLRFRFSRRRTSSNTESHSTFSMDSERGVCISAPAASAIPARTASRSPSSCSGTIGRSDTLVPEQVDFFAKTLESGRAPQGRATVACRSAGTGARGTESRSAVPSVQQRKRLHLFAFSLLSRPAWTGIPVPTTLGRPIRRKDIQCNVASF